MSETWEQRKFSKIAERLSESDVSNNENPSVEYEDVIAGSGELNKDIYSKKIEKKGIKFSSENVLYGKLRPYLHNWLNPDFKGVAVGDWWVLNPISVDKDFLYRLIQTEQFDVAANQSVGTKMPRADWKLISNLDFSLPSSIAEQHKIGLFFNSLDALITLHQRKLFPLKIKKIIRCEFIHDLCSNPLMKGNKVIKPAEKGGNFDLFRKRWNSNFYSHKVIIIYV